MCTPIKTGNVKFELVNNFKYLRPIKIEKIKKYNKVANYI